MRRLFPRQWPLASGVLYVLLTMAGCSGSSLPTTSDAGPLNELNNAYRQATMSLGRPPLNADELKPFVPQGQDVNSLLISPNDGQPYVILWGTDPRTGMDLKPLVIGYEKNGVNGARLVCTAMGVMMMSPEQFEEANFPEGHKPE